MLIQISTTACVESTAVVAMQLGESEGKTVIFVFAIGLDEPIQVHAEEPMQHMRQFMEELNRANIRFKGDLN